MKQPLLTARGKLLADPYRLLLIGLALLYVVLFTHLAWELHAAMRTHKADLGQIDQAIWNSSRGRWLQQTDNGFTATRLTDHVEPILVLISPLYWLWDDVRALLLLQVAAAAIGVLPLYSLALRQFEKLLTAQQRRQVWQREPLQQLTRPLACALGVAYLLAPQLQSALLTEFHAAVLAVPLILWAFWAVEAQRWKQFVVAALLAALVKEEIALLAAGLGLWAVWRAWLESRRARTAGAPSLAGVARYGPYAAGAGVLLAGLLWFVLATFVIVPAYAAPLYGGSESSYFARYGALGDSSADILKSFFTQPQVVWQIATQPARVAYLAGLLAAFGWLALLGPEIVLLSLPLLLANLLSAYPAQYYGEFHYSAPLVPYFAVASAFGLGRLWRWAAPRLSRASPHFQHLPAAGGGTMAAVALLQNAATALQPLLSAGLLLWILGWSGGNYLLHGRGPLGGRYDPAPISAHPLLLERFAAQIPSAAAVTATAAVHPHVSHRQYVYQFPLGLDAPVPADWALLDVTTNTDMAPGDLKTAVDAMLAGDWGVVDAAGGYLLLRRGAPDKSVPPAFYSFTRTPGSVQPGSDQPDSDQDEPLQLVRLAAEDWPRWRQTKLVAEWQVSGDFAAAGEPALAVRTPAGETLATLGTATPPALVWYPPQAWQPGETLRVTTLPLTLPHIFAVTASGGDPDKPALFVREESGALQQLPSDWADAADLGESLSPWLGALQPGLPAAVQLPSGAAIELRGWLPARPLQPGQPLNVWLQWTLPAGMQAWPAELAVFVHLRHTPAGQAADAEAVTVAQADGAPQWFGRPSLPHAQAGAPANALADWRQLPLPADAPAAGEWRVVVGVYDPLTGQRLPLLDGTGAPLGDELTLGQVQVRAPAPPDQACALVNACE